MKDREQKADHPPANTREQRLAEALRANLRRRKAAPSRSRDPGNSGGNVEQSGDSSGKT